MPVLTLAAALGGASQRLNPVRRLAVAVALPVRAASAVLLLVTVALAGCGEPSAPQAAAAGTDGGTVRGLVLTDEQTPVNGATVTMAPSGRVTTTGPAGAFAFADVATGTHTLSVAKPGFVTVERDVEVAGDGDVDVTVTLSPIPSRAPRTEYTPVDGMIACGVSTPVVTSTWSCADDNHKAYVAVNVTGGVHATVHETVWESGSALTGQELLTRLYFDGQMHDRIGGPSPLVRTVDGYQVKGSLEVGEQVYVNFATVDNPLIVAYQQSFTTHFTAFYHQDAPDGYSALAA